MDRDWLHTYVEDWALENRIHPEYYDGHEMLHTYDQGLVAANFADWYCNEFPDGDGTLPIQWDHWYGEVAE